MMTTPYMADIHAAVARLNDEPESRAAFVANPVAYLGVRDAFARGAERLARQLSAPAFTGTSLVYGRRPGRRIAGRRSLPDLVVPSCDALIIVPPFADVDRAASGPHVLQSLAQNRGFNVRVLYANILLAEWMGLDDYEAVSRASGRLLIGERFFAEEAYDRDGRPPSKEGHDPMWRMLTETREWSSQWIRALAERIADARIPIVGCSMMFEQTAASVAILRAIKALAPETITIVGGANCAGPMAAGVSGLSPAIDYVFSGDSDDTFPRFLERIRAGQRPAQRVLTADIYRALDAIPTPDFSDYYAQIARLAGPDGVPLEDVWLPYETSRGCWWGEKHHCTFCGLNGGDMVFREKSPERVMEDLRLLSSRYPSARIFLVDEIMPHSYFQTLLPRLRDELPGLRLFAEQKSNLSLDKTRLLKQAGMIAIQPGIESVSTPLLHLMKKGVTGPQNIALLRYGRSIELPLIWNLLYAFPGDSLEWYAEMSTLAPMLTHLHPPTGLIDVNIERFSPYYEQPQAFGVSNVRPVPSYRDILPDGVDSERIAYQFEADYVTASRNGSSVMTELRTRIDGWCKRWEGPGAAPVLSVTPAGEEVFLFADTRYGAHFELIDRERAAAVLVARDDSPARQWAIDRNAATTGDGTVIPLATADHAVLASFEAL